MEGRDLERLGGRCGWIRQVHENQRRRIGKRQIESFLTMTRHRHGEAAKLQVRREDLSTVWKIINDENLWRHATLRTGTRQATTHADDNDRNSRLDRLATMADGVERSTSRVGSLNA
jgi:hypothetical protein